jgi:hypothetical protein
MLRTRNKMKDDTELYVPINTLDSQVLDHQYKIGLMLVSFALINQIN